MPDQDWKRLARHVTDRRLDPAVGMFRQIDLAEAMGVSTRTTSALESANRTSYSRSTLVMLEYALRWERGSVEAVLAGGEPTRLEDRGPGDPGRSGLLAEVHKLQEQIADLVVRLEKHEEEERGE